MFDRPQAAPTTGRSLWLCAALVAALVLQAVPESASSFGQDPVPFKLEKCIFHVLPEYKDLETVCFRFSRNHIPVVHKLGGNKPRLYFDLYPVQDFDNPLEQDSLGLLILNIRGFLHQKEQRLRMVVDLNPKFDYHVEQKYAPEKNTLCLVIQRQKEEF